VLRTWALAAAPLPAPRVRRLEQRLRSWLRHHGM
jgi:hypothetical protein